MGGGGHGGGAVRIEFEPYKPHDPVWIRAIYAGEEPVGFLMTSEAPDRGEYFLWRLMIAGPYQGKGYGRQAIQLLIDRFIEDLQALSRCVHEHDGARLLELFESAKRIRDAYVRN